MKTFHWKLAFLAILAVACGAASAGILPADLLSPDALAALGAVGGMPFMLGETAQMSITEQIAAFETRRKAAQDAMNEIVNKCASEGRTRDEAEKEKYDAAAADLKSIDEHLAMLREHEKTMVTQAKAVDKTTAAGQGQTTVPGQGVDVAGVISVQRNLPRGTSFTRYAMALALAKGNLAVAERIAQNHFKDTPEVLTVLKAATDAGSTTDTTWAAPLVQYQNMTSEFIELLRAQTILGRLSQLRRVPFNVRIPRQTSGTTGTFVGEGSPAPVKELAFDNLTLPWAKASTIVVITAELAKLGNPSAEALVRADLIAGMSEYLDKRLIDPAYPGVANVSPASLTYGVTPTQATGATLAALDKDIRTVMTTFADANLGLGSGVWVMSASLAIRLSMMRTNQDSKAFPELNVNGGTFYGLPVIVSNNVTGSGSPGDQFLILINQNEVLLADEGQMMLDASQEASVQMNDAPSAGAQSLVSLWQNGLVGLKCDRWIYWTKRRSQAVQFIDKAQSYSS